MRMSIKAFDIASCISKIQLPVECIESCGKILYVGAADSFILQYLIEEQIQPNGTVLFQCTKQKQKYLGVKKPINTIKAASALNRLIVLCDNTLFLLNMFDLEFVHSAAKIKGVVNFCINQDPSISNPFSIEVCVARKRCLQVYNITESKAIHIQDVPLPETPCTMAMDGKFVCVALLTKYAIVDCATGSVQDVLPYDVLVTLPLVIRINKDEFLLSGPNALGIFVTSARISERPPLPWSESVRALAFVHPYILAMDSEYIVIYSILDQKPKQRLQYNGGCHLDNFDGRIYAATASSVYALIPVPWEKQVRALLADKKVTEALELANSCSWPGLSKEQFRKVYRRMQQEAGFIELSEHNYDRAKELFISGQLDPRELISLYPGLLPSGSNFVRTAPPLHEIANVIQMCQGDEKRVKECRYLLIHYLEDIRETKNNIKCRKDVDVALLKLYAEDNSPELTTMIVASNPEGHLTECAEWLERCKHYHALALFYDHNGDQEKALGVWIKLLEGKYTDATFSGLPFVVEYLANLKDYTLLWRYATCVLEKDPEVGVKIFTERPFKEEEQVSSVRPDAVVEYLQVFPQALLKYLEYLVFDREERKEKFHTHLAVLYFDHVLRLYKEKTPDDPQLATARQQLQHMLRFSSNYRVHYLLGRVQETNFHLETAILYGKLDEHEKALKLLVHDLNDPQAAKDYCHHYVQGRDLSDRQTIFHTLLKVYLDPSLDSRRQDELFQPAIYLLNSELSEFNAVDVLRILPDKWPASVVSLFLIRAARKTLTMRSTRQMERSLAKVENIQSRVTRYLVQRDHVTVTEDRSCAVCGKTFEEAELAHFPNGDVAHVLCSKQIENLSGHSACTDPKIHQAPDRRFEPR